MGPQVWVKSETHLGPNPSRAFEILSHLLSIVSPHLPPPRGDSSASGPRGGSEKQVNLHRIAKMQSDGIRVSTDALGAAPHGRPQGCRLSKPPWCRSSGWSKGCQVEQRPLVSRQEASSSAQPDWGCSWRKAPRWEASLGRHPRAAATAEAAAGVQGPEDRRETKHPSGQWLDHI